MLELPLFKKKKTEHFLALDIGTQTIKGLIFKKEREKIIISGSSITPFEPLGVFGSWAFQEDLVKKAITKTIQESLQNFASQNLSRQVQKQEIWPTFLGLPANILKSRVLFQNFERKNAKEKIRESEEKEIIDKALANSQKEISQEIWQESGILARDIHFLDIKISESKIDGYKVSQLSGFSGQNLKFRILNTFLPKYYLEIIERITSDLNLRILGIVQPAYNLPVALEDKKTEGLFFDVGGKITQITFFKEGNIHSTSEFPVGGEIFSQRLSETLGISQAEAEDLKLRYSKRLLTEEIRKKIKEIFWPTSQFWFNSLKAGLKKLFASEIKGLPQNFVFLFGGASLQPEIEEILNEGDWEDLPIFGQPKINILLPKELKKIEDQTKRLNSPQNIPSLLICYHG